MEHLIGHHIGKYHILGEIGRGTVGNVYRAYDPDLDRDVAVKVLSSHAAWDQEFVQKFLEQARATARLKHPHIVAVYDLGQREGWYCIVMENLEGISLKDLARLRGGLLIEEVCAITRQLAGALDYIHGEGLIHGDVRAGNAILTPPDRVVLTELGIVRTSWEGRIATGAATGAIAPEQVTGAELGPWTDLYSLGAIAYELLTGRPPFTAEAVPALLNQVLSQPVPPLAPMRPDLPGDVERVLQQALAKDPQRRYGSGAELAAALEEAAPQPGPLPEPVSAPPLPASAAGPASPDTAAPAPFVLAITPGAAVEGSAPAAELPAARPPDVGAQEALPAPLPRPEATPAAAEAPPLERASIVPGRLPTAAGPEAPSPGPPMPAPVTATVPMPRRPAVRGNPAERLARSGAVISRVTPVPEPATEPALERPAGRRTPPWLWVVLGLEVLILIAGIVLLVLFLVGK